MGNIRSRTETGNLQMDFYYLGKRCREQTSLKNTKENRKRLERLLKEVEFKISQNQFRYADYFPNSKRLAVIESLELERRAPGLTVQVPNLRSNEFFPDREAPCFEDFAWKYFEESLPSWKPSNIRTKKEIIEKKLIPFFGKRVISSITKQDILEFRSVLAKARGKKPDSTMSPSRVNHVMTALKQILDEAADRFDYSTPYRSIKRLKGTRTDVQPFTLEEVQLIIENCRPDFKNYITVKFFTGMRPGEIHGLMWDRVDFGRRIIQINQALVDDEMVTPKTMESYRDIQMTDPVYRALVDQAKVTQSKSKFVFCSRDGTPLTHRNTNQRFWKPLLKMLGLRERSPYQTRHTFATLMLASGEAPAWIAHQLGHANTEMLFKVYTRYVPNLTRRDGSAFAGLLNSHLNSEPDEVSNGSHRTSQATIAQFSSVRKMDSATSLPSKPSKALKAKPASNLGGGGAGLILPEVNASPAATPEPVKSSPPVSVEQTSRQQIFQDMYRNYMFQQQATGPNEGEQQ